MGCGQAKVAEDEADYSALCKHFGEAEVDVYGSHASVLRRMKSEEDKLHKQHLEELRHRKQGLAALSAEQKRALGLSR